MKIPDFRAIIAFMLLILCILCLKSPLQSIEVVEKGKVINAVLVGAAGTYDAKIGDEVRHFRVQYGRRTREEHKVGDTVKFYYLDRYPDTFISTARTLSSYRWDIGILLFMIMLSVWICVYVYVIEPRKDRAEYVRMREEYKQKKISPRRRSPGRD